jgi:2-polyprenyl-6-methoxyphenol hydroxylase-like FAD-dependent oxidoreductase
MATVIVVGGGMAGLATALLGARRGHQMVVVERGAPPPDGDAEALANWERPGVVQAPFAHAFKARSTRVLREEAPDVLEAMLAAGVGSTPVQTGPGFEDDASLEARRPVYEGMLRRAVEVEPGVTVLHDSVRGLVADGSRVRGVRMASTGEVHGDLVVDAGGRRSASGRWLQEVGLPAPHVEDFPADQHYFTRHYRLRPGHGRPAAVPVGQVLPYAVVIVFGGDNGTFSVAASFSREDPLLRCLQDPEVFDRVLREIPLSAPWLDHADPISPVHVMAGLANRRRHLVDGRVQGLALAGDASLYTNPARGHGVSLSLWMAQRLADTLEQWGDGTTSGPGYQAWIDRELRPFFEDEVAFDDAAREQFRAGLTGAGFLPPAGPQRAGAARMVLAQQDEGFAHVATRVAHLLEPVSALEEPGLVRRVEEFLATDPPLVPPDVPLTREAFEALVT